MPVSPELKKLYADAFSQGIFVKEFPVQQGYIAFAASVRKLEAAGFNKERRKKMGLIDANIYMAGAGGNSREEAVKKAVDTYIASESWIPTAPEA